MDIRGNTLQEYMQSYREVGTEYGLVFNWDKLEMTAVGKDVQILKFDGSPVKCKDNMIYLGSLLSSDGRIDTEISRRLGMAQEEFQLLSRVWNHANLSEHKKVEVFNACILSKLIYGIHTAWLTAAQRR